MYETSQEQKILGVLNNLVDFTWADKAKKLNSLGIRTITGVNWTVNNLVQFVRVRKRKITASTPGPKPGPAPVFRSIPDPQSRSVVIKLVEDAALTDKQKVHMLRAYLTS